MTLAVLRVRRKRTRTLRRITIAVVALALALTGCARFDDSGSSPFSPEPSLGQDNPNPKKPDPTTTTPRKRPNLPCIDPDPRVVGTCLDTTGGIIGMPDGQSALVAERRTGRIMQVTVGQQETGQLPVEVARIAVDGSGDGGLLDLALSPNYQEDRLIYAYITTPSDNRIVRFALDDSPKDVFTGIPKGPTGNAGAIDFSDANTMVVVTGDAGNPAAAADPASLAGKLFSITKPTTVAPTAPPKILLSGIGVAGDVCVESATTIWVTDRTATEDRLQKVTDGVPGATPAWTWPDRPGVAGCVALGTTVAVAMTNGKAVGFLTVDATSGAITAPPTLTVQNEFGQIGGLSVGPQGFLWAATVNKTAGEPGQFDDRVVLVPLPAGGGGGPD